MESFAEKPFTINGVKSWIHCLDCYQPGSPDVTKLYNYHYHDYIEFLYALDADMTVWMSGVPYKMETGDLIVINSGEMHTLSFSQNSRYICVKFSPRVLYFDDNSLFEFKYVTPFLSEPGAGDAFLEVSSPTKRPSGVASVRLPISIKLRAEGSSYS